MAIEEWIDEIAKLAGTIPTAEGGRVRSYWCYKKEEFPEVITEFPSAITYVQNMRLVGGGDSGPTILHWRGVTEFHIRQSASKDGMPEVMSYYDKILRAFLSKRRLDGKVASFNLVMNDEGEALVSANLTYGTGEAGLAHLGLAAYWRVKEMVTGLVLGN